MKKAIDVVAALIIKDDKIFLAKRATGDSSLLGKWEFPGGKVDPGESEEKAVEREIEEELGIQVKADFYLTNNVCEYPTKTVNLKLYKCSFTAGNLTLSAHSDYEFVNKDKLLDYDLAPADIKLAEYIKEMEL